MLNNNQISTNKPRDSLVFGDGNYVIKHPMSTNPSHINEWIKRATTQQTLSHSTINDR